MKKFLINLLYGTLGLFVIIVAIALIFSPSSEEAQEATSPQESSVTLVEHKEPSDESDQKSVESVSTTPPTSEKAEKSPIVLAERKVADGKHSFETVRKNLNQALTGTGFSIPQSLKPTSTSDSDVNEVATVQFKKGFILMIVVNKKTKKVNEISTLIGPSELGDDLIPTLIINNILLSNLDPKNASEVVEPVSKMIFAAIKAFLNTKKTLSEELEYGGLTYTVLLSTELGIMTSSAKYPQPK